MKIEQLRVNIWKRLVVFSVLLVSIFFILDRTAYLARLDEEKKRLVFEALEANKVLSDELSVIFHGVQDDFSFFEKEILKIIKSKKNSKEYQSQVNFFLDFLSTHKSYLMVRLTDETGRELFKILEKNEQYYLSQDLIDLSVESFYENLKSVSFDRFYFSGIEPFMVNRKIVKPIKPTVRISKRIKLSNKKEGLLIFNIDGKKILDLFTPEKISKPQLQDERFLLDSRGGLIANYSENKKNDFILRNDGDSIFDFTLFSNIGKRKELQGFMDYHKDLIVYSKIIFPKTQENWILVSKINEQNWKMIVRGKRLTWIFWSLFSFFVLVFVFWRQEKKRFKEEVLEVLLEERNQFIQNVSHQLKTPLAILVNSLNQEDLKNRNEIKYEVNHLIKVVDDLLLLAFVESSPVLPLDSYNILELLSDVIQIAGPKSKNKNITIKLNVDDKLYELNYLLEKKVMCDLLKSAILNILDNAIDFSPENSTIEIFVASVGDRLKILIKDYGPGISSEMRNRLFTRFSHGHKSGRKGTGLGLSIAKKIIELHKGEINLVEFQNGTTFEILI